MVSKTERHNPKWSYGVITVKFIEVKECMDQYEKVTLTIYTVWS